MASAVEITLKAKNEASRVIANVADELGGLGGVIGRVSAGAGPFGAIAGGAATAAAAVVAFSRQVGEASEQLNRLSARTGVSTTDLQVLQNIIKEGWGGG